MNLKEMPLFKLKAHNFTQYFPLFEIKQRKSASIFPHLEVLAFT
ncbi:hypothetical protein [Absicoccus porci]|nr:hypothetical protein [Absicoccus porci]